MKITASDFEALRQRIAPFHTAELQAKYADAGLSDKRYRWDLLYKSGVRIGDGVGSHGDINLYAYLDDTHIDTALKRIIATNQGD